MPAAKVYPYEFGCIFDCTVFFPEVCPSLDTHNPLRDHFQQFHARTWQTMEVLALRQLISSLVLLLGCFHSGYGELHDSFLFMIA